MDFNADWKPQNKMKPGAMPLLLHYALNLNRSNLKMEIDSLHLRLLNT